ncbi:hypothetical protein [Candidatus Chloroploca sp. Khr17]|uniref:hypothetical protein n=1 Tax=Candidatus Chloroploca sp. Khr17 TaxID=2496869 RepID=UPI00101BD81D|nr:hypothetical protein [Candidatus Chloroploca sp. Khr17]
MQRNNLFLPLSLIFTGVALLLILVSGTLSDTTIAQTQVKICPDPAYPNQTLPECLSTQVAMTATTGARATQTQVAKENAYSTETAQSLTTRTPTRTATQSGAGGDTMNEPTATPTPTPTRTNTPTATPVNNGNPTAASTSTLTSTPMATRTPNGEGATITPTSLPDGIEILTCFAQSTVELTGDAEPNTALLLYFNSRPVGGGFTRADGQYKLNLKIGDERPGTHIVEIRERDGRDLVRRLACDIPAPPTPIIP